MFKFDTDRIKRAKYNINIDLKTARLNGEIIAAGDNQVFRTIRRLSKKEVLFDNLDNLFVERRAVKRRENSELNRIRLEEINQEIDTALFVPECISIVSNGKKDYAKLNTVDFFVNGQKFIRLLCSAGNARRNTAIFVSCEIEKELKEILNCGRADIPLVDAKYNAYFALAMTATYPVSEARMAIVDDCITNRTELVDWITECDGEDSVETCNKNLEFNLFDGMGLCSVEQAKRWAKDLGTDYVPSAFCIRNAFLKGMICTFDIQRFAKTVAKNYKFNDLYGNVVDIRNVDIIISKSQLKLWNAYNSCEDYVNKTHDFGFEFGVSKVTPFEDKTTTTLNYQFIQATKQTKDSVVELCKPTLEWFGGILGGSKEYLKLYMFGKACEKNVIDFQDLYDKTEDTIAKAIFLNDDLVEDKYIKNHIYKSINRRIKNSYIGKLVVDGNFQTMLSDPYAFMEHVFDMKVVGLLKRDEYYSCFWNKRNVKTVVGMRAPLTWTSEVNKMKLTTSENINDWYKYITSGIVFNVHGNDCMVAADADFDGDLQMTTDNESLVNNVWGGVPITYAKKSATKNIINDSILYKSDLMAFDPKIGFITNTSSTMYSMINDVVFKYGEFSKEHLAVLNRLKFCRKAQGDTIDSAKGIVVKDFPSWWTSYVKIREDMSEEEVAMYSLSNRIIVEKRPYFFKHLYKEYYTRYLLEKSGYENGFYYKFGKDIPKDTSVLSEDEKRYFENYNKFFSFIDNESTMNLVCHHMEDSVKELKVYNNEFNFGEILISKKFDISDENIEKIKVLYSFFIKSSKKIADKGANRDEFKEKFANLDQLYKEVRKMSAKISSNSQEVANLAVYLCYFLDNKLNKDFVWKVFGNWLIDNLIENKKEKLFFPVQDDCGDIEYLGKKYKNVEVSDIDF